MADMAPVYDALRKAHEAGDTAAAQKLASYIQSQGATQQPAQPESPSVMQQLEGGLKNVGMGALKGASDIGATLISPIDKTGLTGLTPDERRAKLNEFFQQNANPESLPFKGGELAADVAGTAGAGGLIAKGVRAAIPAAGKLASAIESGGFSTGGETAASLLSKEAAQNAATRIAGGAISGGAMAGMVNPNDAGTGSAIGGAIPVVGKIAGESGALLKRVALDPLFKPDQAAINKLVEDAGGIDQAKAAIEKAIGAGKTLSGDSFTLGQAGKNAGLAATERARAAVNPENFQEIYQSQRDARLKAMQGIGKDDVAVQDAIDARDNTAKSLYGKAFESDAMRRDLASQDLQRTAMTGAGGIHQLAPTVAKQQAQDLATPGLRELASRPGFANAVQQAKTLAANKGISIDDPLQSLQGLHYVKLALDDALQPNAVSSLGKNASASIMDMRDKLSEELAKVAPLYGNARSAYADMSTPINQMKVGQKLTDVLTGESVKYGANAGQNAASFFRAMKNAPSIAKAETGIRQPLNKIFDEGQLGTIKQVATELAKDVDLQNLGRGVGSDTAQKLARSNLLSSIVDLANSSKVGRAAMNVATLGTKTRVNNQLDAMLQSPEYAGKALADLTKPQRNALANALMGNTAKTIARSGLVALSQ